jgi:tRNA nucleotidyltransferase (CCA-adding enzyme)
MKVYIVGGYVRDRLMGRPGVDHDFVVVGATHEDMVEAGFKQVGADFPVYLHPVSGDEYALARTEQKDGIGYHGFKVFSDPSVTLEEDLERRDLTINAMAREVIGWDEDGFAKLSDEIIDPFGGQADLAQGILRHVSDAFGDDPVRALRVARFRARYGFNIHPTTFELMWQMRDRGELDNLTRERVWLELSKAMMERQPQLFFDVLRDIGALHVVHMNSDDMCITSPARAQLIFAAQMECSEVQRWIAAIGLNYNYDRTHHILTMLGAPSGLKMSVTMVAYLQDKVLNGNYNSDEGPSVAECLEVFFRKYRVDQNFYNVRDALTSILVHDGMMTKDRIRRLMLALREAADLQPNLSLKGKDIGDDLHDRRMEIFRKYEDDPYA